MNKSKVKQVLDEDRAIIDLLYEKLLSTLNATDKIKFQEAYNQMIEQRSKTIKEKLRIKD